MKNSSHQQSSITNKTAASYNRQASQYEKRWQKYLAHTHQRFLAPVIISADDDLLDLSCGTGLLAKYIIAQGDKFHHLVLNDIADHMQARAKNRFDTTHSVTFTHHPAEVVPFSNGSFDKIFCLNAFHNYTDQASVLERCQQILRPGGRLIVLDWNRSGWFCLANKLIAMRVPEKIDTRSAREMKQQLTRHALQILFEDEWYFGRWKFFHFIAEKRV